MLTPYLDYLIRSNSTLDPKGMGKDFRQGKLPLDEVYVSLAVERPARGAWDRDVLDALTEHEEADRQFAELMKRRVAEAPPIERLSLNMAILQHDRLVIVGHPGSGKTTLLRFLARHFAEACRSGREHVTDKESIDYGDARLPIFVRIARYAEAFVKDRNLTLSAYLLGAFGDVNARPERLRDCFTAFLQAGHALVMLDGLDEVHDPGDRAQVATEIDGFSHGSGANRIAVTSRITGYRAAPLGADFAEFRLLDMNREQIALFLSRYCPAYERAVHPDETPERIAEEAEKTQKALLEAQEKNPGVGRLARNPLLLTILVLVQRNRAHLPHHRIELYQEASEILLYHWQLGRGSAELQVIPDSEALTMFGPVALWLHEERPSGMAPFRDIRDRFVTLHAKWLVRQPEDREIQEGVDRFLKRARETTGLFVERATGYYGFLHLTFEEYWVARQMVAEYRTLAEFIHKHRHLPRWEEPVLLAISYESKHRPSFASDLIRTAIMPPKTVGLDSVFRPDDDEEILHRDLLLAARCLGDCLDADSDLYQEVVDRVVILFFELNAAERFAPLQAMLHERMVYMSGSRGGQLVAERLSARLRLGKASAQSYAAEVLLQISQHLSEAVSALVGLLQSKDPSVRDRAAEVLKQQSALPSPAVLELVDLLRSPEASVRDCAAEVLRQESALSSEAVSTLVGLLQSKEPSVQYHAAEVLLHRGQDVPKAVLVLVGLLQDKDPFLWSRAAGMLSQQSALPSQAVLELVDLLQSKEPSVRDRAADVLRQRSVLPSESVLTLVGLLRSPEASVRDYAAEVLRQQSTLSSEAVSALVRLLQDQKPNAPGRSHAAEVLLQNGAYTSDAESVLVSLLQSPEAFVQSHAAGVLLQSGRHVSDALSTLAGLLLDPNVREHAAGMLLQNGQHLSAAISALVSLLRDPKASVRSRAAEVLGQQCARRGSGLTHDAVEGIVIALRSVLNDPALDGTPVFVRYNRVHDIVWEALWQARARLDSEPHNSL